MNDAESRSWRARLGSSVLGVRDFRLLWLGQSISAIGDSVFPVAVAVRVLDEGGNASDLGLVLAARTLSFVLFLIAGGIVADRMRRTRVMLGADAVRVVAAFGLALTPGSMPIVALAGLTFVMGSGEAFFRPAYGAVVPTVVPTERLPAANGVTSVSLNSAHILGPAVAGVIVATVGWRWAFAVDGLTFIVSIATLVRIREPAHEREERSSALHDALGGIRAVRERPWILAVLIYFSLLLMFAMAPLAVLRPVIAADRLGSRALLGVLLSSFGAGAVTGGAVGTRWRPRRPGVAAMAGLLPIGVLLVGYAESGSLPLLVTAEFCAGLGVEIFQINWISAVQRDVPRHLLARVISLDWMVSLALMPVGFALTGPAVKSLGQRPVLLAGAVVVALGLTTLVVPGLADFRTPGRADDEGELQPPADTLETAALLAEPGAMPAADTPGEIPRSVG